MITSKPDILFQSDGSVDLVETFIPFEGRGSASGYSLDNLTYGQAMVAFGEDLTGLTFDADDLDSLANYYRVDPPVTLIDFSTYGLELHSCPLLYDPRERMFDIIDRPGLWDDGDTSRYPDGILNLDWARVASYLPVFLPPWFDLPVFSQHHWELMIEHIISQPSLIAAFDKRSGFHPGRTVMALTITLKAEVTMTYQGVELTI